MRGGVVQTVAGALALAASLFAIGCGEDGDTSLADLAPPDAPFYIEAVIDPNDDQAEAIDSLTGRLGLDPGAQLIAAINSSFALDDTGLTYEDDVEPWIGDRAAAFVRSFESDGTMLNDFAALIAVTDSGAARDFIERAADASGHEVEQREYEGVKYTFDTTDSSALGVVDDRALVLGSESAFKLAVDASKGESLAESEDYTSHLDPLPDDALATAFFEPGTLIAATIASGSVDPSSAQIVKPLLGGPLSEPIAAALTVEPDAASVDVASTVDSDAADSTESSLLDRLPGDSWFAAALPNLGPTLNRYLDQVTNSGLPGAGRLESQFEHATGLDLGADVFSWLGDAAGFVAGTGSPGIEIGLIAETSDSDGPRRLLGAAQNLIEERSPARSSGPPEGADYGFSFGLPSLSGGAEAGVIDGVLVAVFGASIDQALHPESTLGDDPGYSAAVEALGDGLAPALFLDLPDAIKVAEVGAADNPPGEGLDYDAIRPYVGDLGSLILGSRHTDGLVVTRVTVTLASQ